jgi:predicted dienelactone hydrolase
LALLLVGARPAGADRPDRPDRTDGASGVGLAEIAVPDPINGGQMAGYVFYPSTEPQNGVTNLGPYAVAATLGAPIQPGAKPLVVISHGNGGSRLGHHDLATYLAGHGFVVATIEHPKDNFRDQSGVGHAEVLAGRPIQIAAAVSAVLGDPRWQADPGRIGVAGFSAGGYTSLLVVGAVPKFELIVGYCQRHPDDGVLCATPEIKLGADASARDPQIKQRLAELTAGLTRWGPTADPRVKAAFVMAPLAIELDARGLASIKRPVFLYYGQADRVLIPAENAARIKPLLKTLAGVKSVADADHWVFLPPCSPALARDVPMICRDPPGVDRAAVGAQVHADALAFFRKTLHVTSP